MSPADRSSGPPTPPSPGPGAPRRSPAPGGWSRLAGKIFESPDNPLGWSISVFSVRGVRVRVHLLTIVFCALLLVWSIAPANQGAGFMALAVVSLLGVVLVHELGHVAACRWVGGSADRVVILPFGGLSVGRAPETWRAWLISAAGGPAASAALVPVTSFLLIVGGLEDHVLFNPLEPMTHLRGVVSGGASSTLAAYAKVALWWLHATNIMVLAINVLVPAYPLDGARIAQALLWSRIGYAAAVERVVVAGYVAAMLLAVVGLAANQSALAALAAIVGWASWAERRRARAFDELASAPPSAFEDASGLSPEERARREQLADAERHAHQVELDRILEKIGREGMDALTRGEKRALREATERKRRQ